MLVVILAAGVGGRLGAHTDALPKPLVPLHGRPMLEYTLDSLAEAGVGCAVVVTGYRSSQVRDALSARGRTSPQVCFVENPRFEAGASLSLLAARDSCQDRPFLLVMSDHLLSAGVVRALLDAAEDPPAPGACFVAADFTAHAREYTEEAAKVRVGAGGRVEAIGKDLERWDALDTGAFLLSSSAWDAFEEAPEDCELSVLFGVLARRGLLFAADTGGAFWYDVDTPEDLAAAGAALSVQAGAV
ncbi:MAG: NTP transferase domain-containing protein [Gemmataceae bacterium]|nr:NTP transferase domain-containing protein [Gemmataceae bacterium]